MTQKSLATFAYSSPLGEIFFLGDNAHIHALWFAGDRHFPSNPMKQYPAEEFPLFLQAQAWLDAYFAGQNPPVSLPLLAEGTPFQQKVWALLGKIPYGHTTTYGALAKELSLAYGRPMSAQAVGQAVGRNPISLLIPCHRVIGSTGKLVGYASGLPIKEALLHLEQHPAIDKHCAVLP